MIDQRAFDVVCKRHRDLDIVGIPQLGLKEFIEAYEAAKPRSHDQAGLNAMGKVLDPVAFMDGVHPDASASRQAQARLLASKALKAYQETASTPPASEDDK